MGEAEDIDSKVPWKDGFKAHVCLRIKEALNMKVHISRARLKGYI